MRQIPREPTQALRDGLTQACARERGGRPILAQLLDRLLRGAVVEGHSGEAVVGLRCVELGFVGGEGGVELFGAETRFFAGGAFGGGEGWVVFVELLGGRGLVVSGAAGVGAGGSALAGCATAAATSAASATAGCC